MATYTGVELFCIISFCLICFLGIVGNSLVVYVYGFTWRRRYMKFERLMLMLGAFDLAASVINPIFFIYRISNKYSDWHFGTAGCKIISSLGPIFSSISLGIILVMAIDRDRAVATPFKKQFTIHTIYKAVFVIVVLSITVCVPYMYYLKVKSGKYCFVFDTGRLYDTLIVAIFLTSDILFVAILVTTTIRVFLKLKRKQMINCPKTREYRAKETNRILKIIFAMGIMFTICIFPRDLLFISVHFSKLYPPVVNTRKLWNVNEVLKILQTANSCVNVILYSVLNKRFRREVRRLLSKVPFVAMPYEESKSSDDTNASIRTNDTFDINGSGKLPRRNESLLKWVLNKDESKL